MEIEVDRIVEEDDFWNNEADHKWAMELIRRNVDIKLFN